MSTNEKGVSTAVTTATTEPAVMPDDIYTAMAQERLLEHKRWQELLPRIVIPTTANGARSLSNAASVPPEFVELTNVALAKTTALVRVDGATPAQIRDLMRYADAHEPLADELEASAHFLRYSCAAARNAAGSEALTTYSLAQRLAKRPEYAHLRPHVADMRRALGRHRKLAPEEAAKRAAERAAKAAAKVAKQAAKLLAAAPDTGIVTK